MFQDFQLSITHLSDNRYFLRTEKVAAGVPLAEEQVEWDVDRWLVEARQLMNDPLSRLLQGTGRLSENNLLITAENEGLQLITDTPKLATNLIEFGQKLHQALFIGSLKESWSKAQAIAHNQKQILRLRLGFKENRLLSLPWEVMNYADLNAQDFQSITTGIETSFSRYHSKSHGSSTTPSMGDVQEKPLKILMVLASPEDQDRLELKQEAEHLLSELEKDSPVEIPPLELTILDNPGRQELTEILEQGQYQVFHYAGHSNLGHFGGDIYLVNRATGLTEPFAGDDLAGLLANNSVQFAIFNSCHGADGIPQTQPQEFSDKNLAQALVRRGIPAVLAMSAQIPDQVALTFTRLLYRNLHQGYPIDFSLGRVRQGLISAYGSDQLYWALPVLYMNPKFHGLLHHRPLNQEGLKELLRRSDVEVSMLSMEDEMLLGMTPPQHSVESFWDEDEDDESLFAPPPESSGDLGDDTAFIKGILSEISSDLQEIKQEKVYGTVDPVTAEPKGLVPAATTPTDNLRQRLQRYRGQIAVGAAIAIGLGGLFYWQRSQRVRNIQIPIVGTQPVQTQSDLAALDVAKLTQLAIEQAQGQNWENMYKSVRQLLDQQALPQAYVVLFETVQQAVDPATIEPAARRAELSFLQGRYAWQSALKIGATGDRTFEVQDARRYWETARGNNPKSLEYVTAIGFAFYAEKNYNDANQAWYDALTLADDLNQPVSQQAQIYAGLALGVYQLAQSQTGEERETLLGKASKLQATAMELAPDAMRPTALAQNWLWSEQAIADWQKLITLK